jgi:hypothetical protein
MNRKEFMQEQMIRIVYRQNSLEKNEMIPFKVFEEKMQEIKNINGDVLEIYFCEEWR